MACDTCKSSPIKISDLTETNFRKNIFVKTFLFIIGGILFTLFIPIVYLIIFKIVFFNKETNIDLVDIYSKIFRFKKQEVIENEEITENNINDVETFRKRNIPFVPIKDRTFLSEGVKDEIK